MSLALVRFEDLEDTPKQKNWYDCGVHVCWAMETLIGRLVGACDEDESDNMSIGNQILDGKAMRSKTRDAYFAMGNQRYLTVLDNLPIAREPISSSRLVRSGC